MVGPHHVSLHCLLSFPLSFPDRWNPQCCGRPSTEPKGMEKSKWRERRLSFWGKLQGSLMWCFFCVCLKKVSSRLFSFYIHYHQRVKYSWAIIFMYFLGCRHPFRVLVLLGTCSVSNVSRLPFLGPLKGVPKKTVQRSPQQVFTWTPRVICRVGVLWKS